MDHVHYNKTHFPHFVGNHGNWDIYRNDSDNCAAIPTPEAARKGCQASHFGNMAHVRATLGDAWLEQQATGQLSKAPEVMTTVSLKGSASGETFQVVGWLKPFERAQAPGKALMFCLQEEATHVWCQSLWARGPEVNDVAARVTELKVEGLRRRDNFHVLKHAKTLAAQHMTLDAAQVPRWS